MAAVLVFLVSAVTVEIGHRLFSSDIRILACRVAPDPFSSGLCCKRLVSAAGRRFWLCPERLTIFMSKDGGSLNGVRCGAAGPVVEEGD